METGVAMSSNNTIQNHRVGVMGGTFDPVHYGHLFIAECSRYRFNLAKVLFIPSGRPVHKKRGNILEPQHRLEMTRLAVKSNPFFEISSIEVDRPGPTYAVDTLEQLHLDNESRDKYFYITGADAILEILTWKDVPKVFEMCSFIAVTRPGYSLDGLNRVLRNLSQEQREKIHIFETTGILISSTEIRQRVNRGEPIKYLVPEEVEQYILTHKLYKV